MTFLLAEGNDVGATILKIIDRCHSCTQGVATNSSDVSIANSISYYLYCIVLVCMAGFFTGEFLEFIARGIS